MTVSSWPDVPEGITAHHHHCVASVESAHDPKLWVDASQEEPGMVAWSSADAVQWVYDQLCEHRDAAVGAHRYAIAARIAEFEQDAAMPESGLPTLWQRLPNTLGRGRWAMETWQLGTGRKLVLQILVYANHNQVRNTGYAVCNQHRRQTEGAQQ